VTYFGRRYGWSYASATALQTSLVKLLMDLVPAILSGSDSDLAAISASVERQSFEHSYATLCKRNSDPFWTCPQVCPGGACLYRYHAARLLPDARLTQAFDLALARAGERSSAGEGEKAGETWDDLSFIDQAIFRLVGYQADSHVQRSAGLCYATEWIAGRSGMLDRARRIAFESLREALDRRGMSQE
jgi:hypothetical protein